MLEGDVLVRSRPLRESRGSVRLWLDLVYVPDMDYWYLQLRGWRDPDDVYALPGLLIREKDALSTFGKISIPW